MLRLILAYTLAALATLALPTLPPWWLAVLALAAALLPWRYRPLTLALAAGFALTLWRGQVQLADRWPLARQGEAISVSGRVASLPEHSQDQRAQAPRRKSDTGEHIWRFTFAPDDAALPARIRVSWYRTDQRVQGGDCWRLNLRIKAPHGSQNPGGFDYEGWLFRQGIGATATVRSAEPCVARGGYPVLRLREALREKLELWLADSPARALIPALVLGDDSGLRDSDWQAYRLTGTSHLVAISGFNLAIVAGFAYWLLRWAWSLLPALCLRLPAQKAASVGAALLATFYALLAGFEPPVLRALVMLWVILAALFLNRLSAPSRVLGFAWGLIVFSDPFALLSPGLWLSFGAVATIAWLASGRLAPEAGWRQALRIQLVLSFALAPLTLFWFQGISWIAPFVNLLAVPLFALLTPLLLVAVLAALLLPGIGVALLGWTAAALSAVQAALYSLAETHGEHWLSIAPGPAMLLLGLFGVLLLSAPRGVPLRVLGLLCFVPLAFPPQQAPARGFDLAVLDVGQGLAVVVRTAGHSLLFDAGPAYEESFDAGESVVVPYLLQAGVRQLDTMLISHSDLDHRGGAPAVRQRLKPLRELGALAQQPCRVGEHWQWDGVDFEILNGPDGNGLDSDNNGGCVLRVATGKHAVLLPADIERASEQRLLDARPQKLRAEVLVAAHHGSKTSSTPAFVAAVNPDLVIFSAGFANSYHHPHPSVLSRYQALGSALAMTGHAGAVMLHLDPDTGLSEVREWRRQAPRWWWAPVMAIPGTE